MSNENVTPTPPIHSPWAIIAGVIAVVALVYGDAFGSWRLTMQTWLMAVAICLAYIGGQRS